MPEPFELQEIEYCEAAKSEEGLTVFNDDSVTRTGQEFLERACE